MPIEYRPVEKNEQAAFGTAISRGFGNHPPGDEESRQRFFNACDHARTIAALEDGEFVGTSGSFLHDTTVPGGRAVPAAAVTFVTVAATHRRQGILTNMMRMILTEAHERGEPLATLWASESVIYGRFGYGMAGQHYEGEISTTHAALAQTPDCGGNVSFIDRKKFREVAPVIWDRTRARRPGMPERKPYAWDWNHSLPDDETKPDKRFFYVLYEEAGQPLGYAAYKIKEVGGDFEQKALHVQDHIAETDAAHAALWRYLLNVDLIRSVKFENMPLDDPLWWMLADPRRLKRHPYDAIWLRMIDVPTALTARRYAVDDSLVVELVDDFCPWNNGRYELEAGPDGSECRATQREADLVMPAASLATGYLGGALFSDLARASRVEERSSGALLRADAMFAAERAPWCPLGY
jgi:predicted acetyltransferase